MSDIGYAQLTLEQKGNRGYSKVMRENWVVCVYGSFARTVLQMQVAERISNTQVKTECIRQ
jgi:ribulose-5-phosphate 4-epimerase/fuculose-1-phosphate aldolase